MLHGQDRPANVIFPEHILPGRRQMGDIGEFAEELLIIEDVAAVDEHLVFWYIAHEVTAPAVLVEHFSVDRLRMRSQVINRRHRKPIRRNLSLHYWMTT